MDICKRLRSRDVLHGAWLQVRRSGFASESERTRQATAAFDQKFYRNLDRIARQLRSGTFLFAGEIGAAISKGKGKTGRRPLVVAPVENRVVRRAILDVLQGPSNPNQAGWHGVPAIREVMSTPTSIGGIAKRGVPHGLALVDRAVVDGLHWFIRSDIRDFFTRIPRNQVCNFVNSATNNSEFSRLFQSALETNLENASELEERKHFILFPDEENGVAQGSALSALAGNIVLADFDAQMNGRGIVCVRYIDDFIILGRTASAAQKAFAAARRHLQALGMEVYDPTDQAARKAGKVDIGNIFDGTDILGYRMSGRSLQPSAAAGQRIVAKVKSIADEACAEMAATVEGGTADHRRKYHQSVVLIHKTVWGWAQAFRHTSAHQAFAAIDAEIDRHIRRMNAEVRRLGQNADAAVRRRLIGVHLLTDTRTIPLPKIDTT